MHDFLLPDLGEGLTEAHVIGWRVVIGEDVAVDQVVVEVETAKAVVEVPIPLAGTVHALHARPGESVLVGAPLITIAEPGGQVTPTLGSPAAEGHSPPSRSGNVLVGSGTIEDTVLRRTAVRPLAGGDRAYGSVVAVISPAVRRLARDLSVDLSQISGTGPTGLILREDVEAAASKSEGTRTGDGQVAAAFGALEAGVRRIPLTGLRGEAANKLLRSRRDIPEATVWVDVDATALLEARAELSQRNSTDRVSVLTLLLAFTAAGLKQFPELNARIEAGALQVHDAINIGIAAQTDHGLVLPVVRDVQLMSVHQLSASIADLIVAARTSRLRPKDLTGGTFTVNNYGVFGVDGSAAIINEPEVAMLGIGRIIDKPWVVDGELAVRKLTQLTLAFDHRACDGRTAGGFLRFIADCVEKPSLVLGDL